MAVEDDVAGRWGVQFHPESILSASGRAGHQVIGNVLRLATARSRERGRQHGLLSGRRYRLLSVLLA